MLLSVLILIGAILVPSEYQWLYSTHIILVCLYLIGTHRFWLLFLTFLSLISWQLSETNGVPAFSLLKSQALFFSPQSKRLYSEGDVGWQMAGAKSLSVRLKDAHGVRYFYQDVQFEPFSSRPERALRVTLKEVVAPAKNESWMSRRLYTERQLALLDVTSDERLIPTEHRAPTLRRTINERLQGVFAHYPSWRFSKALLLGDNKDWDERDKWMVRALGLAHLFVVSGLHTGFVFVFGRILSRVCWRLAPNRWVLSGVNCWLVDAVIIIPILIFYAYLTGWGAPVVRAAIMLSLYLVSKVLFTQPSPYKVVMFALWGILLFDPRAVLQPGLWLSFSLVSCLIAFSQSTQHWTRIFLLQCMLSTASMVLIWGWQASVSVVSVPLNLFMVPLAAFLWFPLGVMASVEGLFNQTSYLYGVIDFGLLHILRGLEALAFQLPMLDFDTFLNAFSKSLLLLLVVFWIWQWPLRRGWLCLLLIWCVLLIPRDKLSGVQYQVVNRAGELAFEKESEIRLSSRWHREDVAQRLLILFDEQSQWNSLALLLAANDEELEPAVLLKEKIDWVLFKKTPSEAMQSRLRGLQIDWLSIEPGEALLFRREKGLVSVRHLTCSFSIFLFKSDTCRRVEKLEFMLN
ncbi:MAG: ComEC/Rec2 family competence protein [Marinomonas sp.]